MCLGLILRSMLGFFWCWLFKVSAEASGFQIFLGLILLDSLFHAWVVFGGLVV